jgi:predicted DsbA family dithiol-disulfide isomerase
VPGSAVQDTERVPLDRLPSTCAPGVQLLKQPTTLTGPSCTSAGSTHVTVTIPFFIMRVLITAPAKHTADRPDRVTSLVTDCARAYVQVRAPGVSKLITMRVEIWSDVICPWCYIGKTRFEQALAGFEHRDEVEVVYRSFELDPSRDSIESVEQMLVSRYGPQAREMEQRVAEMARSEGLGYRTDREVGNTFDVHRVLHLARAHGLEQALMTALFQANFAEARSLFTGDTLLDVAVSVGLDKAEVQRVLDDLAVYADEVREEQREATRLGSSAVPFFVLDRKIGVSGGQSTEVFAQALRQAWAS